LTEAAVGPIHETPQEVWSPAEPVDLDAPVGELVRTLDGQVQTVIASHQRLGVLLTVTVFALTITFGTGSYAFSLEIPPIEAVAFMSVMAVLCYVMYWNRAASAALLPYGTAMDRQARTIWWHLNSAAPNKREGLLREWREDAPFAVAWIDGYWSAKSLLHR